MGLGLPVEIPPDLPRVDILRAMHFDKKKDSDVIRFSLPVTIGEVRFGIEVESPELIFTEA
jgi:3-dehydroquinate synthetase